MSNLTIFFGCWIVELKADREKAQAAYDYAAAQASPSANIDPEKIAAFSKLMTDLLDNGETPARKAYLRTLIGAIIVSDKSVKIVGSREAEKQRSREAEKQRSREAKRRRQSGHPLCAEV